VTDLGEVDFKARAPHPVLGPALWLFGSALWSYVVAGELVVAQGFPEPFGALGVLFAIGVTWLFAIEHSFRADAPTPETRSQRLFAPLGMALGLWLATLLISAVVGLSSRANLDGLITVGLWLFSLIPFFVGRRMTRSQHSQPDAGRRALAVLLRIGAALITLVALLPIIK
jgi:dipeptide/tripeptide permease